MICFTVRGVRVEIHFLFVAVLTLCMLLDETQIAVMGLLASLMHEAGHVAALGLTGCKPRRLAFEISGIALEQGARAMTVRQELVVLLAGSAVNLVFFGAAAWLSGSPERAGAFAAVHLVLGIVNLLPVSALDGGKILRLLLEQVVPLRTAERICFVIQIVLLCAVITICALSLRGGVVNVSLFVFVFYLFSMVLLSQEN